MKKRYVSIALLYVAAFVPASRADMDQLASALKNIGEGTKVETTETKSEDVKALENKFNTLVQLPSFIPDFISHIDDQTDFDAAWIKTQLGNLMVSDFPENSPLETLLDKLSLDKRYTVLKNLTKEYFSDIKQAALSLKALTKEKTIKKDDESYKKLSDLIEKLEQRHQISEKSIEFKDLITPRTFIADFLARLDKETPNFAEALKVVRFTKLIDELQSHKNEAYKKLYDELEKNQDYDDINNYFEDFFDENVEKIKKAAESYQKSAVPTEKEKIAEEVGKAYTSYVTKKKSDITFSGSAFGI